METQAMREMGGRVYLKVACLGLHVERRDKPSQVLPWCIREKHACLAGRAALWESCITVHEQLL